MNSWVWWWAVWAMWWAVMGEVIPIFPKHQSCNRSTNSVKCDLTHEKDRHVILDIPYDLQTIKNWYIIGALSLVITGQCSNEITTELFIQNCTDVQTRSTNQHQCMFKVRLEGSIAKDISHATKILVLEKDSEAERINLDSVEQFDLRDSEIVEISIIATKDMSTVFHSTILEVKKMKLNGDFKFMTSNSNFGNMRGFNYNSTNDKSSMYGVEVKRVFSRGLIISRGKLTMEEVIFGTLDSEAILMKAGTEMVVKNSIIYNAFVDSWIMDGGNLEFMNVTVEDQLGVSFKINNVKAGVKPLAFVLDCSSSNLYLVGGISALLALLVGFLVGCGMVYLLVQWKTLFSKSQDNEGMQLVPPDTSLPSQPPGLPSQPPPSTPTPVRGPPISQEKEFEEDNGELYEDVQQPQNNFLVGGACLSPPPLPPSLTTPSQQRSDEAEVQEELYEDVVQTDPSQCLPQRPFNPPPGPSLGPPLPTRDPPSPGGILGQHKGTNKPRPPPPIRSDSTKFSLPFSSSLLDERDALPPPPPLDDDQENYDDIENLHQSTAVKPPFVLSKLSYLHPGRKTPDRPSPAAKPANSPGGLMGKILQGKQWPPKKPPLPPSHNVKPIPTQPPGTNDTDEDDIYEDI